jgi:hypothetical protein
MLRSHSLYLALCVVVLAFGFSRLMQAHACELHHAAIAAAALRSTAHELAAALEEAAAHFFKLWLEALL